MPAMIAHEMYLMQGLFSALLCDGEQDSTRGGSVLVGSISQKILSLIDVCHAFLLA